MEKIVIQPPRSGRGGGRGDDDDDDEDNDDWSNVDGDVSSAAGLSPSGAVVYTQYPAIPMRRYVTATMFVYAMALVTLYWLAFPVVNSIFFDGYPQFGSLLPGVVVTTRYGWDWWMVWFLTWNVLPPMTLAWALTHNRIEEYTRIHAATCGIAMAADGIAFVVLSYRWVLYCNTAYSNWDTACNDYRWCGVFWPNSWCPNNGPFTPAVTLGNLHRNAEMTQHWVFSLVFIGLQWWQWSMNDDLKHWGVLH